MTGEITLTGRVLRIGGVKEKTLAARRAGIREVIVPEGNRKDVEEEVPPQVKENLTFHYAGSIADVLALALEVERDRSEELDKAELAVVKAAS